MGVLAFKLLTINSDPFVKIMTVIRSNDISRNNVTSLEEKRKFVTGTLYIIKLLNYGSLAVISLIIIARKVNLR